jgi:hypothetical protein
VPCTAPDGRSAFPYFTASIFDILLSSTHGAQATLGVLSGCSSDLGRILTYSSTAPNFMCPFGCTQAATERVKSSAKANADSSDSSDCPYRVGGDTTVRTLKCATEPSCVRACGRAGVRACEESGGVRGGCKTVRHRRPWATHSARACSRSSACCCWLAGSSRMSGGTHAQTHQPWIVSRRCSGLSNQGHCDLNL